MGGGTGAQIFTVAPPTVTQAMIDSDPNAPFLDRMSKVDFTIGDGAGNYASKSIFLRQVNYTVQPVGFVGYPVNQTLTARVRANADWTLSVTDASGVLDSYGPTSGTANINPGTAFTYKFKATATNGTAVTFTFSSPTGKFDPVSITVKVGIAYSFARSNIVLKDGKLTFATTPADNATIPANVQGLHFFFGSLVGVSSDGTHLTPFAANHVVFSPAGYPKPTTAAGFKWFAITKASYPTTDDDFIMAYPGVGYKVSDGLGDICRYISDQPGWVEGRWRIPTQAEYQALLDETINNGLLQGLNFGSFTTQTISGSNPNYGMYQIPSGWLMGVGAAWGDASTNMNTPGDGRVFFPTSGQRLASQMLRHPGSAGYYWSSTASADSFGYYSYLVKTKFQTPNFNDRTYGLSIRCIRE